MPNKPRDLIDYLSTLDPDAPIISALFTKDDLVRVLENMDNDEVIDWATDNKEDLWESYAKSYPVERELGWLFEGVDNYLWEHIEAEFKKNLLNKEDN